MITSIHTMIYSDDAQATRAFLRDVLGMPFVDCGYGDDGWLIFGTGPSELGVHPTQSEWEGKVYEHPRAHTISIMCDDIHATMSELSAKGATFATEVEEQVYGLCVMMNVPGADPIQLYQPLHLTAYNL